MNTKIFVALIVFVTAILTGCGGNAPKHLSADEAIKFMQDEKNYLIVDVRTLEEYEKKHIPNAILVPIDHLRAGNFDALPDKNQALLLYCWTGRRAETAAQILTDNGYTKVYEFGGLVDWTGDVEGAEVDN